MIHPPPPIALCFAWIAILAGCNTATTPAGDGANGQRDGHRVRRRRELGGAGPVAASTVATATPAPHPDPATRISRGRSIYRLRRVLGSKTDHASLIQPPPRYLVATPALRSGSKVTPNEWRARIQPRAR